LQRNDRPGDRTSRQAKTCIWVEYRQHQISALIDTGSDVSLAGDKLAQELEWIIHAHSTEAVSIANNGTMTIRGAIRVVVVVAGRSVMSEILIAPDFDGLLLGINWLRSQGCVRWDFDRGEIEFGKQDWIKLRRETEQPPQTSINRKDFPMAKCEIGIDRSYFHAGPTDPARRFCCSRLNRKFLHEVSLFCRAMNLVEIGRERGRSCNLGCD